MLENQLIKILQILYVKRETNATYLAQSLKISVQTLHKNIELLQDQIKEFAYIKKSNNQYELSIYDISAFQIVMCGSLKKVSDYNSASKRYAYILKQLLNIDSYILIDDLSYELEVSRSTINKDIKAIKDLINPYNASIIGVQNKGIKINVDEINARLIILDFIFDYFSDEFTIIEPLKVEIEFICDYLNLDFTSKTRFSKVCAISIKRIIQQKQVTKLNPAYFNIIDVSIFEHFKALIEYNYHKVLCDNEISFISYPLNIKQNNAHNHKSDDTSLLNIFQEINNDIMNNYHVDLAKTDIYTKIKEHLIFLINRMLFKVELLDLFNDDIALKYPFSFQLALSAASILEKTLATPMSISEKNYLAIYFELALSQNKQDKQNYIALITNIGPAGATLIQQQLETIIGSDCLVHHYSESNANKLDFSLYSVIFSMVPIELNTNIPIIQIVDIFNQQLIL